MKKSVLALSAALAAFGLSVAYAGEMKAEKATPQEAAADPAAEQEARTAAAFAKADSNADGFVTEAEAKAYWKGVSKEKVAAGEPALTEEEMAGHMDAFKKLSGEDAKATLEEVKAYQVAQMEAAKAAEAAKSAQGDVAEDGNKAVKSQ